VNTGGRRADDSANDRFDEARAADQPDPDDPEAPLYTSTELEDEDGEPYVIQQQNVGRGRELGRRMARSRHTTAAACARCGLSGAIPERRGGAGSRHWCHGIGAHPRTAGTDEPARG
jgi:hypothetical protein